MTLQSQQADRQQNLTAILLIGVAMILGGGGSPSPMPEVALQVICALFLAAWAVTAPFPLFRASTPAWLVAGALLALPVVQLVPLPPAIWHHLPGRESEQAALALIGAEGTWQPWSVAPARTLAALLALLVPTTVLMMVASLDRHGRAMAVGMVAGIGLLALVVGVAQMAGGEANTLRFYVPDQPYLNGFQANHNSAADVLLIAMVAFAAVVRLVGESRRGALGPAMRLGLVAGGTMLFSLGVFVTASRAGAMLLPVAWCGVAAIIWPWLRMPPRKGWALVAAAALVIAAGLLALSANGVVMRLISRYEFGGEFRPQLWRDAIFAVNQFFPLGSGLGTFVPVFIAAERLEVVDATMPNRAHNDYLELLVEGGVAGAIVLSIVSSLVARQLWRSLRDADQRARPQAIFAFATLAIIALHSLVDYPLRSMSLACIAAVAAGLLMPPAHARRAEN